jgi:hypothetical protein
MDDDGAFKCPRCWVRHRQADNFGFTPEQIANNPKECPETEKLCDRCMEVIVNDHSNHWSAPYVQQCIINKYEILQ